MAKRVGQLIWALTLAFLSISSANADCSTNVGKVVFNEIQDPSSGTTYLELRILDPSILAATGNFAGWKVDVYKNNVGTKTSLDLSSVFSDIAKNNCGQSSAWIRIPDSSISNFIHNSNSVNDLNFVLYETAGSKKIVDILRWGAATSFYGATSNYDSCSTIEDALPSSSYDSPWISNGYKDWYRTPDGTGTWGNGQSANNANSVCNSNDGAAGQMGLSKVASVASVAVNTNFSYTLYAQNATGSAQSNAVISDNLTSAGLTFVSCAPKTPDTCTYAAGILTWTIGTTTNPFALNTTKSAVLTVKAASVGVKTNTITSNTTGTPSISTVVTVYSAPSVSTSLATGITANGATINGTVSSNYSQTTATFEYGTTSGTYGTSVNATPSPQDLANPYNVSYSLTGLVCGTVYFFRAKGVNSAGTTYSSPELSFTTSACPVTASSFTAYETNISNTSAQTSGNRVITTRVASTSGSLCSSGLSTVASSLPTGSKTCSLTVAALASGAVATAYSGTISAKLQYCNNVSRSSSTMQSGHAASPRAPATCG